MHLKTIDNNHSQLTSFEWEGKIITGLCQVILSPCENLFKSVLKANWRQKVSDKQRENQKVNGVDVPKKSNTGDALAFEKIVSWDLRVSDVRTGTF